MILMSTQIDSIKLEDYDTVQEYHKIQVINKFPPYSNLHF